MTTTLHQRLRAAKVREGHGSGFTKAAAKATGVSYRQFTRWLDGSAPAIQHADRLSQYLDRLERKQSKP